MKKKIIKPFDLKAYKNGAKIRTRDGHEVRIICTDAKHIFYPIIALVKLADYSEITQSYTSKGKINTDAISDNDIVIVEEVEEPEYWSDNENNTFHGFSIMNVPIDNIFTEVEAAPNTKDNYHLFVTMKQAKSALAMARIGQILANDIENFGGVITDDEWEDNDTKYIIYRRNNEICSASSTFQYFFLAFHTKEQRDLFLEKYYDLVKEYLMFG